MSEASQQQMSHADSHDLDKLVRWKADLDIATEKGDYAIPVCAIFLVSPDDRASHDVFRRYRSVFEEMGGGFHNLVIFGQHGVSATQEAFLSEAGLGQENVPMLAIAPVSSAPGPVYCIELPKGERGGELDDSQTWGISLESVRDSVSRAVPLDLGVVDGLTKGSFRRGALPETVNGVLADLSG